jgi:Ulp1 family protease
MKLREVPSYALWPSGQLHHLSSVPHPQHTLDKDARISWQTKIETAELHQHIPQTESAFFNTALRMKPAFAAKQEIRSAPDSFKIFKLQALWLHKKCLIRFAQNSQSMAQPHGAFKDL